MNRKLQAFLIKIIQLHVRKKSETEFRNPKRPLKISNIRNNSKREPIKTFHRFDCLSGDESLNEIPEANDSNEKTVSRNKIRISGNQRIGKSTKKLTELGGDSIIRDAEGWEIFDRENKFVVRHFPGVKTDNMKTCVVPTIKQNPETIVICCGKNRKRSWKGCRKHTRIGSPIQNRQ